LIPSSKRRELRGVVGKKRLNKWLNIVVSGAPVDARVTVGAAAEAAAAVAERSASMSQLKMLLNRKTCGILGTNIPFEHMTF